PGAFRSARRLVPTGRSADLGLAGDVRHLCRESGVGAVIDARRLPIAEETRAAARALGGDLLGWALGGGEDYELVFTAPPGAVKTDRESTRLNSSHVKTSYAV